MIVSIKSVDVTATECRKLAYILDGKQYAVFVSVSSQLGRDLNGKLYNVTVDVVVSNLFLFKKDGSIDSMHSTVEKHVFTDMYESELVEFDQKFIYHFHNETLHALKK